MQFVPLQQVCEAPPQVVGVTHVPALHTRPPAQGSLPAQHAAFMEPQAPVPASPPRQVPPVQVSARMHAVPPQHGSEAPPQLVGVTHIPPLHTNSPAQGSVPGQHAAFIEPQPPPEPASALDPRQTPLVQV